MVVLKMAAGSAAARSETSSGSRSSPTRYDAFGVREAGSF
jgi:hypothetical protein